MKKLIEQEKTNLGVERITIVFGKKSPNMTNIQKKL